MTTDLLPPRQMPSRDRRLVTPMKGTTMQKSLRNTMGLLGSAALALAAITTTTAPAHANPNWTLYNEGTGAPLTSSDTIGGTGTAVFAATIAGVPRTISCNLAGLTLSTSGPFSGAPGSSLTVNATPPSSLTCTSGSLNVPVTITGTWGVTFTVPAAGTTPGQLYNGTLTGTLDVPLNSVNADLSAFVAGCSAVGPTTPTTGKPTKNFGGSYNASNGAVSATANQSFTAAATGCTVTSTRLASANITANPIIDLQW